jgi:hypothetical protein
MTTFRQDIRYGIRTLRDRPAFTLVATLSLALGIGANATIFSIINATLLAPLGLEHEERLVALTTHHSTFRTIEERRIPRVRGWRQRRASRRSARLDGAEILGGESDGTSPAEDVIAKRGGPR